MNRVLAYEVCSELEQDREFALRFQGRGGAETLVQYFTSRGIDRGDALVLALAYMAGTGHTTVQIERTMDRVAAKR